MRIRKFVNAFITYSALTYCATLVRGVVLCAAPSFNRLILSGQARNTSEFETYLETATAANMNDGAVRRMLLKLGLLFFFCHRSEAIYGYSYADCTYLSGNEVSSHYGGRCFCYRSSAAIKWKDICSTYKVSIDGEDGVRLVYPMETRDCHRPDDFITLSMCLFEHYWPSSFTEEKSLDIPLIDQEVCFMVKSKRSSVKYTLQVSDKKLNRFYFGLFITGVTLFIFAGAVCRSSLFYYGAGVSLGVISIFIFLLLVLRNFIPNRGVFVILFGATSSLSYLGFQQLLANWEEVMSTYKREILGYLLASGFISFVVCYKKGPITDERTLNLMTLLLAICRLIGWLLRSFLGLFGRPRWWRRQPRVRLLTEEEYREQGEVHTRTALEGLREHCTRPDFPAWDTVLRLRSPQRFASFLRGDSHISPEESQSHDQQYGLGGAYFEGLIFPGQVSGQPPSRGAPQHGGGDDLSEDEQEYSEAPLTPPIPPHSLAPHRSPAPSLPVGGAVPLPPAHTPQVFPYPALPYTPYSQTTDSEDLEPF
ncbi:hypothetical protein GJAV_G00253860 [Gymnothorax javanicus]|nr:hypothetical protein GJAV_G00253860 [Gymnothorax javanicus]